MEIDDENEEEPLEGRYGSIVSDSRINLRLNTFNHRVDDHFTVQYQ